jgi:hypothetical protein
MNDDDDIKIQCEPEKELPPHPIYDEQSAYRSRVKKCGQYQGFVDPDYGPINNNLDTFKWASK